MTLRIKNVLITIFFTLSVFASAAEPTALYAASAIYPLVSTDQSERYTVYLKRIDGIRYEKDIKSSGFTIIQYQQFLIHHQTWGEIFFIPTIDRQTGRMVLFFSNENEEIVFKTDAIAGNHVVRGSLNQPNIWLAGVAFRDLNDDGFTDIILVIDCKLEDDSDSTLSFKVADVLFQDENGYFNDRRVADRLNRFGMNSSIDIVTAHVWGKQSTEFLYTAHTLDELKANGFGIITPNVASTYFEKFGQVNIIPGTYKISEQYVFMIYLVDEDGRIVWNFQPMGGHDNFNHVKGILFQDMDGDGLKDLLVLARYVELNNDYSTRYADDFSVYYQRAGYFSTDTEFKEAYTLSRDDTPETVLEAVRAFWRPSHD